MSSSKKLYRSKIGFELIIPITLVLGLISYLLAGERAVWIGIILIATVFAFIIHMFLTTIYLIEDNILTIKCGFFYHREIDINSIKKISRSYNPISSPATSLDRIEIFFDKSGTVLISPKQKKEFIADLLTVDPGIKMQL